MAGQSEAQAQVSQLSEEVAGTEDPMLAKAKKKMMQNLPQMVILNRNEKAYLIKLDLVS